MITLTISDEQVAAMKESLENDYFDEPVNVTEYAIMVWLQETLAQLIGSTDHYANGSSLSHNTSCPYFELNAPIRDSDREYLPGADITSRDVAEAQRINEFEMWGPEGRPF